MLKDEDGGLEPLDPYETYQPFDIGPGMQMLIDMLNHEPGDMAISFDTPNGWGVSIIRAQPSLVELPGIDPQLAGGSYGAAAGLFEVALMRNGEVVFDGPILHEPKGWLKAEDVARLVRTIFELPAA